MFVCLFVSFSFICSHFHNIFQFSAHLYAKSLCYHLHVETNNPNPYSQIQRSHMRDFRLPFFALLGRCAPQVGCGLIRINMIFVSSLRNYCCHKPEVLICVTLKTEFNTQSSFHIPVNEDESTLINNTGVWSTGYPVPPYYGKLTPDQVYCCRTAVKLTDAVQSGVDRMCAKSNTDMSCWYRRDASEEATLYVECRGVLLIPNVNVSRH